MAYGGGRQPRQLCPQLSKIDGCWSAFAGFGLRDLPEPTTMSGSLMGGA